MKHRILTTVFASILVIAATIVMSHLMGCTSDQLNGFAANANKGHDALVGTTTQPANPIVTTGEVIYPPATPWVGIAGAVLGIVATGATVVAKWETSDAKHAVQEVVSDVKAWSQPNVPFSTKTQKIVADVAGIVAAAPIPNAPAT